MSRRDVLFAIYPGECGGPFAIVLAAFTLSNEVLLIVQTPDFFEIWTTRNFVGRNYTFRNRATNGMRQPLEMLVTSWLQSSPGDLCLLPEYVDVATTPIGMPTKEEFLQMWETNGRAPTPDWLRSLMTIWLFESYSFPLFTSLEVKAITSHSFSNLREQFQTLCSGCNECQRADMSMCVKDPRISQQHTMCDKHLYVYLEGHIQLLRGALAVQPIYEPQYLLCPWCLAIVDVSTLITLGLPDLNFVSLVVEFQSLLSQSSAH